jgi:hypothetical protein
MIRAVVLGLLILPGVASAQGYGFLLKIQDPTGTVGDEAQVALSGPDGSTTATVRDDGEMPDAIAGDGAYSVSVSERLGTPLSIVVTSGDSSWTGTAELDLESDKPEVRLRLRASGVAEVAESDLELSPVATVDQDQAPPPPGVSPGIGLWIWGILALGIGIGVGIAVVRLGRRPGSASPLEWGSGPEVEPRRIESADLPAALAGPLAETRLAVLGSLRSPPGNAILCREQAPLPVELVRAVERLAVEPGPPVALLLTGPDLLDRPGPRDPLEELALEVGGRFPLWVVGGPAGWTRWSPGAE